MKFPSAVLFFSFSLLTSHFPPAFAAFESRPVGARAVALGSAFTAVDNDVTSVYWNPAALTTLVLRELEFTYVDLYSQGLVNLSNLAFGHPGVGPGAFALSWTRMGVTNKVPFDYSENTYSAAYGLALKKNFALGTSINYYKLNSSVKGSGYGLGGSFHFRPVEYLTLAGVYENLGRTTVRYDSGAEDPMPDSLRFGAGVSVKDSKVYFELSDALADRKNHLGLEFAMLDNQLAFRGGVNRGFKKQKQWTYALGFGARIRGLGVDYAFENHFDLGGSHVVSVKWRF